MEGGRNERGEGPDRGIMITVKRVRKEKGHGGEWRGGRIVCKENLVLKV